MYKCKYLNYREINCNHDLILTAIWGFYSMTKQNHFFYNFVKLGRVVFAFVGFYHVYKNLLFVLSYNIYFSFTDQLQKP
jgi:hypothetical protein